MSVSMEVASWLQEESIELRTEVLDTHSLWTTENNVKLLKSKGCESGMITIQINR